MFPFISGAAGRAAAAAGLVILVGACSTTAPASPNATTQLPTNASQTPVSPAGTTSPSPSAAAEPTPIEPGTVHEEAALKPLWSAKGPVPARHAGNPSIDPQGRLWVLPDSQADAQSLLWSFDRDGAFRETWGTAGKGDGQFDFHRDSDMFGSVGFAPDGSLYVAEAGNHRVEHFDAQRHYLGQWGTFGTGDTQFVTPNLLKVDGLGRVFVNDDELTRIKVFTADGTFIRSVPNGYPFFDVDAQGHLLVVGRDDVLREYDPDGEVVRAIDLKGLVSFVAGIAKDRDGHVWIGSNIDDVLVSHPDRLLELAADGTLLHDWNGTAIDGIALDPKGDRLFTGFYEPDILLAYTLPKE
jgi:hypothetical protein